MVYTRPPASDFDDWANVHQNPGWTFSDLQPLFKKAREISRMSYCNFALTDICLLRRKRIRPHQAYRRTGTTALSKSHMAQRCTTSARTTSLPSCSTTRPARWCMMEVL